MTEVADAGSNGPGVVTVVGSGPVKQLIKASSSSSNATVQNGPNSSVPTETNSLQPGEDAGTSHSGGGGGE